jgi:hypothetical protein
MLARLILEVLLDSEPQTRQQIYEVMKKGLGGQLDHVAFLLALGELRGSNLIEGEWREPYNTPFAISEEGRLEVLRRSPDVLRIVEIHDLLVDLQGGGDVNYREVLACYGPVATRVAVVAAIIESVGGHGVHPEQARQHVKTRMRQCGAWKDTDMVF